jgi:hypothetical protein
MKITLFAKNVVVTTKILTIQYRASHVVQQVLIFFSKSILVYFTKQIENNEIMRM